jgi:hypothetical protein
MGLHMNQGKILAAAILAAAPISANAVTLGQLDIVGNLNPSTSQYTPTGQVDFLGEGTSTSATGIFSSVVTVDEALGNPFDPTTFDLFDVAFAGPNPQVIFSGAGFSFTATEFLNFDNVFPGRAFEARGFVAGPSGNLVGSFSLSTQATTPQQTLVSFSSTTIAIPLPASALMLIAALGTLGWLSYRSRATVI